MDCSMPGFPVPHHLPEFAQVHVHWVNDAIQPHHPLSSPSPPALNLSQHQGLFQWVPLHQVAKVLELQLQHQSFQWGFRVDLKIDWFDLLAVQETLKSLLQDHSSKASILQRSAFFIVQLSQSSVTTGKTIALTMWIFVSKVAPLLFNTLSSLWQPSYQEALAFCFHGCSGLRAQGERVCHCFPSSPSICHEVLGPDAMITFFLMFSFKLAFSLSSFKRFFSSCFLPFEWYRLQIWGCWYFSRQSWFQLALHPCSISHDVLCTCSAGWQETALATPFSVLNQSIVPHKALTVASWLAYGFLRRQVRWSGLLISFKSFSQLLWSTLSKALA